jgi:hypothetical protein
MERGSWGSSSFFGSIRRGRPCPSSDVPSATDTTPFSNSGSFALRVMPFASGDWSGAVKLWSVGEQGLRGLCRPD